MGNRDHSKRPLEAILAVFQGIKPQGHNKWLALCPCHNDHEPSLSITLDGIQILLHCHAGCSIDAVLSKVGLIKADLYLDNKPFGLKKVSKRYDYQDVGGKLLYQVQRYDDKTFSVRRPTDNGTWVSGMGDIKPVIYRLPQIIKAVKAQTPIIIPEGEKDADTLALLGRDATTNPFGAGKWKKEYSDVFQGAGTVIITPDNDQPGRDHAMAVADSLFGRVSSLKVIELPGLPEKGDITNWLEAGNTLQQLDDLVANAPEYKPESNTPSHEQAPKPEFINRGSAYEFAMKEANAKVIFTRLHQHKSGDFTAQILVEKCDPPQTVHYQTLNLAAPTSRKAFANNLNDKIPGFPWPELVEDICFRVVRAYSQGQPVEAVWGDIEDYAVLKAKYLLAPLIYESESNILFGPGKSGKSYLALLFCILCRLPYLNNPFGLIPKASNPLYLDYERSKTIFQQRLSLLCRGLSVPPVAIDYRRCTIALADDVDNILKILSERKNDMIVVDSVGVACAGDLNSSETATRFAAALHSLPVTSILITHTSKTEEGKKTPIGSVFFTNSASNIFEVKKAQECGDGFIDIAFSHYECNLGPKIEPIGFKLEFSKDDTRITRQNVANTPALEGVLPIRQQCKQALGSGTLTVKEIAEATGQNEGSIKTTLNRYKDTFTKEGEKWRLKPA